MTSLAVGPVVGLGPAVDERAAGGRFWAGGGDRARAHGAWDAVPAAAGAARRFVTGRLRQWGVDRVVYLAGPAQETEVGVGEAAELVVGELVANSVAETIRNTAAGDAPPVTPPPLAQPALVHAPVEVQVRVTGDRLLCEVWDAWPRLPVCYQPGLDDESGRGLLLVDSYTTGWTCYLSPSGIGKVTAAWWHLPDLAGGVTLVGSSANDTSWLEEGAFSTPAQATKRLGVGEETIRAWARAGVIRYIADGVPVRYLLCDDDLDVLVDLLHHVKRPSLPLIRTLLAARRNTQGTVAQETVPPPRISPD